MMCLDYSKLQASFADPNKYRYSFRRPETNTPVEDLLSYKLRSIQVAMSAGTQYLYNIEKSH